MKKKSIFIVLIVLIIWNIVLTILLVNNKEKITTVTEENVYGISTDLTKVVESSYSSVVNVKSSYGKQTGFIYKQEDNIAYIITTYHGIGKDNTVTVTFANGKSSVASLVGYDTLKDVAILSIESQYLLNVVKCGDNEYTNKGEFIICIGSSSDTKKANEVELGIVSNNIISIDDKITTGKETYNTQKEMLSLSLNVNNGYSGSPIFNMKSEVIGMIQMSDEDGTYSLTINEIKIIADKIINKTEYEKIDLGVKGKYIKYLEDYEKNMLNIVFDTINGYYVEDVLPLSLGSKIGIMPGDVIVSINNTQITGQKDLLNCLYSNLNNELLVVVNRADDQLELKGAIND